MEAFTGRFRRGKKKIQEIVLALKHLKTFESFDLEKFMKDPEGYFHDDTKEEIEEGDYITSYRGNGQVLSIDGNFAKIELFDSPNTIVRVPFENLKKLSRNQALSLKSGTVNSQRELKILLNEASNYLEIIETTDDKGEEKISGNLESSINYLENLLIEVLALRGKDPYTTNYLEFSKLVGIVARLSHFIIDKSIDNETVEKVTSILDKFYEISE